MKQDSLIRKYWLQSILFRFIAQIVLFIWLITISSFLIQMTYFSQIVVCSLISLSLFYSAYQKKGNKFLLFYLIYLLVINLRDIRIEWNQLFETTLSTSIFVLFTTLEIVVWITSFRLFQTNRKSRIKIQ